MTGLRTTQSNRWDVLVTDLVFEGLAVTPRTSSLSTHSCTEAFPAGFERLSRKKLELLCSVLELILIARTTETNSLGKN